MSGPVAGVIGGIAVGRAAGYDSVITLDVGGTSADIGVAPGGQLRMKHLYDTNLGGYDVMVPMVDLDTIGAGGGSIARIDAGGLLRVGPAERGRRPGAGLLRRAGARSPRPPTRRRCSAGCVPGAARGQPRARRGVGARVDGASSAGSSAWAPTEAALGVTQIVTQNMVNAISINSVQQGFDPRDFSLVAFGGGGPLYGVDIARELSDPARDRPAPSRHHLSDGAAGLRPEVRDASGP